MLLIYKKWQLDWLAIIIFHMWKSTDQNYKLLTDKFLGIVNNMLFWKKNL